MGMDFQMIVRKGVCQSLSACYQIDRGRVGWVCVMFRTVDQNL